MRSQKTVYCTNCALAQAPQVPQVPQVIGALK